MAETDLITRPDETAARALPANVEAEAAFLGAVLIDVIDNSLIRWLAISEFWRDALLGLLILLAVATDTVIMNRLRKAWSRHELQVTDSEPPATTGGASHAI